MRRENITNLRTLYWEFYDVVKRWAKCSPSSSIPKQYLHSSLTERTFVVRDKNGLAEWVNVQKGPGEGDLVRVIGPLQESDRVVMRATDEIREGTNLKPAAK